MNNKKSQLPKPVILLIIDTLMSYPLEVAVQTGRAPALQFLMEKGCYISNMVSSFPTMSVTIDSSLLTGTYADQHHIPGLNWFDESQKKMINYGTGFREAFKLGMHQVIYNMLYRLNNEHLSSDVTTIYEDLAEMGIPSASINSFIYRGNTPQQLHIPRLLSTLSDLQDSEWTKATPNVLDRDLPLSVIIERLRNDARIDIISWKNGDYINVVSSIRPGSLRYNKGGEYTDIYEQTWSIEGNTDLLDLYITDKGKVFYGDYPDALARLYGALHSHPGRFIVVNAKPGCEFKAQSTPFHLGGSAHGSLHKQESLVPLVIAGTTATPKFPRLVDMKDFVLQLFRQQ
jgi:hypothetical protein